jgi:hypothetical protein
MTDDLDGVRDHYRATGLTERLKTALMVLGPQDARLTPEQLGALDQFHTRSPPTCRFWMSAPALAGRRAFWPRPIAAE